MGKITPNRQSIREEMEKQIGRAKVKIYLNLDATYPRCPNQRWPPDLLVEKGALS
jgi:hypothetical protein